MLKYVFICKIMNFRGLGWNSQLLNEVIENKVSVLIN